LSSASAQASERTQVTSRHLLRGAYSLAANTAVTSLLGMGFWVAAARLYSNVEIGRDAALIAAMLELSTICQLNLGNGILRFLPHLGARGARAVGIAYALASAMGLVLGSSFVLLAPRVSHQFAFMSASTTLEVGFVVALLLWGVFALQDAVLTATRRAPWIPIENGAFGVLKILALPVLLAAGAVHGVFLAWAIPMALLLIPVNLLVFRLAIPEHLAGGVGARTSSLERRRTGRAVRFLGQDYLASIFTQATLTVLPLLVLAILGARNSAYFAIPLMIALAFDTLAYSACTSLVVEASLEERHLGDLAEVVVRRVLAPLAPAGLLLIILAPLVLAPFGEAYAQHGAGVLRLLLCASLFRAGIALFSAVSRVERRGIRLGLIELALLVLVLGPAIPLADAYGVEGVGAGWLLANGAIFLAVLPWLLRVLREPRALQDE
jgi:O-antigen/teichoic acid export membrane protein